MPFIRIKNANIISPHAVQKNSSLLIKGAKIAAVGKTALVPVGALEIDARGCFVAPGFIDTHIHGSPEKILRREIKSGTTSVVIAISCASVEKIFDEVDAIRDFIKHSPLGPAVLGIRLEGPYINKKRRGAQNARYIRKPDASELLQIINRSRPLLKIVTIAPELKGAEALIQLLLKKGVIASIGHSDATYEEAVSGIETGISHVTHIFNGMRQVDRRQPGAVTAALINDDVTAEIILDHIHVHRALFRLLARAKDLEKVILITDSVAAGPPVGAGKNRGIYRFDNGTIAGSSLTMIEAVRNAVLAGGLSVSDAVELATLNPARLLGINRRKGALTVGMDADIVIFDRNFDVKITFVNGNILYSKLPVPSKGPAPLIY